VDAIARHAESHVATHDCARVHLPHLHVLEIVNGCAVMSEYSSRRLVAQGSLEELRAGVEVGSSPAEAATSMAPTREVDSRADFSSHCGWIASRQQELCG